MKMKNIVLFHSPALMIILMILTSSMSQTLAQNKGGNVTDIQGNIYKTIIIGEQEWMGENLKATKFNNGTDIPNVTDMTDWVRISTPAYAWYNNDISNKETYGALYNWYTVNAGNLCPDGWRVPTDADWIILTDFLGENSVAGGKLKATGNKYWNTQNKDATNESSFSALPGGYRYGYYWSSGIFYERGTNGYCWSATECTDTHVWTRTMNTGNSKVYRSFFTKNNGFSVRCIKSY